jgi:ADP-heptose:LPS heptosyltransferase
MSKSKKILIVRFSSIGDIVLTTPVIRCVREQTGAEVHFLTKKGFRGVLDGNPFLSKIYSVEKSYEEIIEQLKDEGYDLILDLQHNMHSWRLKRALKIRAYSFPKLNIEKWLLVNTRINIMPEKHIVDRYLSTTLSLGVHNDGKGLDYFIPEQSEVKSEEYLPGRGSYAAFVIGAAHFTKRLPEEKIIAICRKLNHPVVLLGGKEEAAIGAQIAQESGIHVYNACGKFNLHQSASWVRQSAIVISHDTGLMHIAAAFQKKIISVWGNTMPVLGMYPYYADGINNNFSVEVNGLPCRPCSKIGYQKCPKGHFKCMQLINVNLIAAKVNEVFS